MESDPQDQDTYWAQKLTLTGLGLHDESWKPTGNDFVLLILLKYTSETYHLEKSFWSLGDSHEIKFLLTSSQAYVSIQGSFRQRELYLTITIFEMFPPSPD